MRTTLVAASLAVVTAGSAMLAIIPARAADEPRVRVEYDPPLLSVAAREVALGELLKVIGAKVGFTVAEGQAASRPVTVSIASVSVDDALRQLLRAENHTILYRQGANAMVMIDRIVLLGAPAEGVSAADTRLRQAQEAQAVAPSPSDIAASPQTAAAAGAVPVSARAGESASTDEPQQVSVGDMLKSHALAGLPAQPSAVAEPAAPPMPRSLEESLAITTQRAQQGLTSLVEGLERATRSLQQSAPAPTTGR